MLFAGVDIPRELLLVQRKERLVIFAGAGAAITLAHQKLLNDPHDCTEFLRPFLGDDDSLASAICGAERNGVPQETLSTALSQLSIDTEDLIKRLEDWHCTMPAARVNLQASVDSLNRIGKQPRNS